MRVLVTHELFPPDFVGGGEKIVLELVKGLIKNWIEVEVVTTGDPKITAFEGIPTTRLPINRYSMNFAWSAIRKKARDFDLIQTNNYNACYPSFVAGKSLKKPVVCLVHGAYGKKWYKMRGPIFGFFSKEIEKFQLTRDYSRVVFYSNFARDAGIEIGIKPEKTSVFYPGVEFDKFSVGKKESYVLFVGRLSKQKGLDDLIAVAREMPDVKFKLVGTGEEESRLKSIVPENVEFLGFLSGKPLFDVYSKASVFCLPSVGETFGLVLLEAMASGCAIVSTVPVDFEGARFEYGDRTALKNALRRFIDDPKETERAGLKNRELARKYSWDKFAKSFVGLYEDLLKK